AERLGDALAPGADLDGEAGGPGCGRRARDRTGGIGEGQPGGQRAARDRPGVGRCPARGRERRRVSHSRRRRGQRRRRDGARAGGGPATAVSLVLPTTDPIVAEIVAVPGASAVARPEELITVTFGADDAHATWLVTSFVLPSEYVPMAVNCCVLPTVTVGFAGVTVIEVKGRSCGVALASGELALPPPASGSPV